MTAPYERSLYGHWVDADGDCQDTRQEVLIAESARPVTLDLRGCRVLSGLWNDPFTGREFVDPRQLDIDHFIPLAEAHRSGAHAWTAAKRRQFANDLANAHTLVAVWASANRSKGDRDPASWMPPDTTYHCEYLRVWVGLKEYWGLSQNASERQYIKQRIVMC